VFAPKPRDFERYAALEARIRALPPRDGEAFRAAVLTDELALIGLYVAKAGGDGTAPAHFRAANEKTVAKELRALESRARNLADKIESGGRVSRAREQLAVLIDGLHGQTLETLANLPMQATDGQALSIDWAYFRLGLPRDLRAVGDISPNALRIFAVAARRALKIETEIPNVGRPPDNRAIMVGNILAHGYFNLTGLEPTFTVFKGAANEGDLGGAFLAFVSDIFELLNIDRDAISYAGQAAYALRGKGRGRKALKK
jgi:hypothetical protein